MTKRRGKRRSRRGRRPERKPQATRRPDSQLELALQQAERAIERNRPRRAIKQLEPFLTSHPDNLDLHHCLGYAYATVGAIWAAMSEYEQAQALSEDRSYWLPLASLYLEAGFSVHALRAFRQASEQDMFTPMRKEIHATVAALEQDLSETARQLDLPIEQVEQGLRHMEEGRRALSDSDFQGSIAANRQAIRQLGDWPPPHNNLSLALFFDGQPEEAFKEMHRVLSRHPGNLQALSNGVRFLTWSGREDEARDLWATLEDVTPQDSNDRVKKAEAAAVVSEDEQVYQILKPLDEPAAAEELPPQLLQRVRFFLAVAEANLGRRRDARRRLAALRDAEPSAEDHLAALKQGQPGLGWAERFPYFRLTDLLPAQAMEALIELSRQEDEMPPRRFRRQMSRFVARFPQSVHVGEKMLWEERQPEAGISFLSTLGTPEAYAALRRFGLSQAGDDEARFDALTALAEAGEIQEGEALRVWLDGEWRQVELRKQIVSEEEWRESDYSPEAADLLNRGIDASQRDDAERAEQLFERVLELEPGAKEAYNNLGAIYAGRGEHERAKKMFREALNVDPLYAFPRCNLASYLLDEDKVEEAEAMLEPLSEAGELFPPEVAFYTFTQARVLVHREEYGAAKRALKTVLRIRPEYEPAQDLLDWIETFGELSASFRSYWEQQRERDLARRKRLQAKLSTPDPTLAQALPLHIKNALTGMGRVVIPWGGWSGLRKAELIEEIIDALTDRGNLKRIVNDLRVEEQDALRAVLDRGGTMAWEDFDDRYGSDLEESRYWSWHVPETTMGRLRLRGLLVEATVDDELRIVVPVDLREGLGETLG